MSDNSICVDIELEKVVVALLARTVNPSKQRIGRDAISLFHSELPFKAPVGPWCCLRLFLRAAGHCTQHTCIHVSMEQLCAAAVVRAACTSTHTTAKPAQAAACCLVMIIYSDNIFSLLSRQSSDHCNTLYSA